MSHVSTQIHKENAINTVSIGPVCAERGWLPDHVSGWLRPQQLHFIILRSLFLQPLRLAEQFFIVGSASAPGTDMSRITHILFVKLEITFQLLLHFAKRLGHL